MVIAVAPVELTNQSAFDFVCTHLSQMHDRAMKDGNCQYRAVDDLGNVTACAVGCLLTDSEVQKLIDIDNTNTNSHEFPGSGIAYFLAIYPEAVPERIRKLDHRLLSDLQIIHDSVFNWNLVHGFVGYENLKNIAMVYNLDSAHLDSLVENSDLPDKFKQRYRET
jgi:hypothetical protein